MYSHSNQRGDMKLLYMTQAHEHVLLGDYDNNNSTQYFCKDSTQLK